MEWNKNKKVAIVEEIKTKWTKTSSSKWHERNGEVQINIIFELNENSVLVSSSTAKVWARSIPQEYAYHIKMDVLQSMALKSLSTYNLIYSRDSPLISLLLSNKRMYKRETKIRNEKPTK